MTSPRRHLAVLCALAGFAHLTACGDDSTPADTTPDAGDVTDTTDTTDGSAAPPDADPADTDGSATADIEEDTTLPLPDEDCDDTLRPIVMAHGFLASGDTYGAHFQRFSANGYCRDRLFAYDWNTLGQGLDRVGLLDAFIQDVLTRTGATQVDLAGHSAGGGLGYDYLEEPERAARVAHYAHIGSFANDAPAGPADSPVPTLNLYSEGDTVVADGGDIPGATNVKLITEDHYGVATSAASFDAIFRHYNDGTPPTTTDIVPETRPVVAGRALSLGENLPAAGAAIQIWALDSATGLRAAATPVATFTADELGYWGPVELLPATHYEFFITPTGDDAVPIHYYREPFVRSNQGVYLRTLPNPDSLAGILLAGLPFSDDATILVNFTSSTGILAGTDSLVINGVEMATEELASADQTTIALFLYDENQNATSDNVTVATFASFPFLKGYDQFYAADPTQFIEVNLNGRILRSPRWPSLTGGVSITIFD
jgi:pimeloyl-ACP methyl ester carboxylesterase